MVARLPLGLQTRGGSALLRPAPRGYSFRRRA
uniref:Uncharacterized protein n=1 Tax=Cucumis melo TaxID=3656 RepID=A0A9I9E3H2_CUCME